MKKLMGYLVAFSGVALALMISLMLPIHAKAATKYTVRWNGSDWSAADDEVHWTSKDFAETHFTAGDVLVVDGAGSSSGILELNIPAQISEVAVMGNAKVNITAPGADKAYATTGSTLIFNGSVNTLVGNYGATDQINGNVGNFQGVYSFGKPVVVGVTGTVGSANVMLPSDPYKQVTIYNVAAGKFKLNDNDTNTLATASTDYSLTPTGTTAGNTTAANGNQLDSVPKTGDMRYAVIFFSLAAIATFAGLAVLGKKRANVK